MVMVLFASVAAVPVLHQPISNLTHHHKSSHHLPMSHLVQRTLNDSSGASKVPHTLRPVVPSYNQSHNQSTQIFRHLTQVLSGKTPPSQSKKVEEFAKKLRADMEAQERVLNVYIKTIKDRHSTTESKLKTVKIILKGLKDEINNATKYANAYQSQDTDLTKQDTMYRVEYEKSKKMYDDEAANIRFEKQFLDEIIKYIQLRKSNCPTK